MRVFCATVVASVTLYAGAKAQAELANGIKAIVNDAVITYQQVESSAAQAAELLWRQYGKQPEVFQKKLAETRSDALEQLVNRQLILHDFKTGGYNLPDSVIDDEVQDRIRSRYGTRATLIKTLQADGVTYEKFRQQLREQFIVAALSSKNISQEIVISPNKIEAYYADHRDEFKLEDQVKLRMIVLDSAAGDTADSRKKLGQEVLAKIKEGAAFDEMARVYSTGSQRSQGGDWGWVERSVWRKELAEVAFALKPGTPSDVIEMPTASYLMLVEEKRPSHILPLNEVRADIETTLLIQERARLQKQWIEKLKTKTFVRYF